MSRTHRAAAAIIPALAVFLTAQYLGSVRKIEPFHTYLYLFSWAPFLFVLDRLVWLRRGRSYFPGSLDWRQAKMGLWTLTASTTFWLIFEAINFRVNNWIYLGLPTQAWIRWPGYALSYATVLPGVMVLTEIVESYHLKTSSTPRLLYTEIIGRRWCLAVGLTMLFLPLLFPKYFFPLVWGALFFLLEPGVQFLGGHSLLQDWRNGEWGKTTSLLAAGMICGLFWEGCNIGAGAKWRYTIPFVDFLKIGEMPLLGFLGFPAFALELFAMQQFSQKLWERLGRPQKAAVIGGVAVFWLMAFWGIDSLTAVWK